MVQLDGPTSSTQHSVVLTEEQRAAVRSNGCISDARMRIDIDHDLVRVTVLGLLELRDLFLQFRVWEEVLRLHKRLYVMIVDVYGSPPLSSEQRRVIADWDRRHGGNAVALVNDGNRVANTIISLMLRALNLFRRKQLKVSFFRSEAEARAWLDTLRRDPAKSAD